MVPLPAIGFALDAFVVKGFTPIPEAFLFILNIRARALLIFWRPAGVLEA
jgi:hypothetical protein